MSDERTVYVSPSTEPGDSVRYGDWQDKPGTHTWYDGPESPDNPLGKYRAGGLPLTIIEYATGSDYSGNLVEASNARVLHEQFPWLVTIYGGHGTFGLGYLGKRENQNPELIAALDALEQYPLADEGDHSELERETVDAAWEDYGRDDFRRALVEYFDAAYTPATHDLDACPDETIDTLWCDCTERLCGGEEYVNESGDVIHFPVRDVAEKITRNWPGLNKPSYDGARPSIAEQLNTIASEYTVQTSTAQGAAL